MEARVEKHGDVVVVHLIGCLDYETLDPFRTTCLEHLSKENVVFNLAHLNFVGSSGITSFVDAMVELKAVKKKNFKFCSVSSEFRRIFAASEVRDIEIFDSQQHACLSFQLNSMGQGVPQSFITKAFEIEADGAD